MHQSIFAAVLMFAATAQAEGSQWGFGVLVPSIKLSASTDESGTLKASLPLMAQYGGLSLIGSPYLETSSSNGVAKLFSGDDSIPWRGGATLSVTLANVDKGRANDASINAMKVVTYDICRRNCSGDECKNFKPDATTAEKTDATVVLCPSVQEAWTEYRQGTVKGTALRSALYDGCALECAGQAGCAWSVEKPAPEKMTAELCENGQAVIGTLSREHPLAPSQFPAWKFSGGLLSGAEQFTWLEGATKGDPNAVLSQKRELRYSLKAGLSATHTHGLTDQYGLTVELHGLYESSFSGSAATAHACDAVGNLSGAAAQQCSDTALGAPSETTTYGLELDVGVADRLDAKWRAALGARWQPTAPGSPASFAFLLPVYVNLATAPAGYAGSYKGLLRVTPTVSFSRDPTLGIVPTGLITVDIYGDMNMFPEVLDYR